MNILITGATGFVGSSLTSRLSNGSDNIKCLVRNQKKAQILKDYDVQICNGDLLVKDSLLSATKGIDIVYHCAALVTDWAPKEQFHKVNVVGTNNLLEACFKNQVKKIVHVSSNDAVWAFDDHINIDETHNYPEKFKHPYSQTKSLSEQLVMKYNDDNKVQAVVIRPCLVWGPGDTVILPRLAEMALNNNMVIIGSGNNKVSLTYIDNLVDALILAGKNEQAYGNIYFINDDIEITFKEFISALLNSLNIKWSYPKSIPYNIAYLIAIIMELYAAATREYNNPPLLTRYAVAAMGKNLNYNINKAKISLNYRPKVTFNEGLANLGMWIDSIGGIESLVDMVKQQ